jgi:peptidoglycan/xylan/chitin deacetylase (PgdA/CDA1 family)
MKAPFSTRREWLASAGYALTGGILASCAHKPKPGGSASVPESKPGVLRGADLLMPSTLPTNVKDTYVSVSVPGKYIALTYDDGPHATLTPKLLDILKARNVKSTFFVIGRNVNAYPDIVKRAVEEGHEIGNHTHTHPSLSKLSDAGVQKEVTQCNEAIEKAIGNKPNTLRPPYGATNDRVKRLLMSDYRLPSILWSVDPLDWKRPGASVVSSRLVSGAGPGGILLAHDIHAGTIEATPSVLDKLLASGYQFLTVSQLIRMGSGGGTSATSPIYSPGVL